jgi:hypothetical protein
MTSTIQSLFEARLRYDDTFRATTGIVSVNSGSTLSLHLNHNGSSDDRFLIESFSFSSKGPVSVVVYDQPGSVTTGTELNIKNNSTGVDRSSNEELTAYQGSSFTNAEVHDASLAGSESTGQTVTSGAASIPVTSLAEAGGDLMMELTNDSGSDSWESVLTIVGMRV